MLLIERLEECQLEPASERQKGEAPQADLAHLEAQHIQGIHVIFFSEECAHQTLGFRGQENDLTISKLEFKVVSM